jgi:ankyrin repeat protein
LHISYYLEQRASEEADIVKLLLDYGADVNLNNNLELTALMRIKVTKKKLLEHC